MLLLTWGLGLTLNASTFWVRSHWSSFRLWRKRCAPSLTVNGPLLLLCSGKQNQMKAIFFCVCHCGDALKWQCDVRARLHWVSASMLRYDWLNCLDFVNNLSESPQKWVATPINQMWCKRWRSKSIIDAKCKRGLGNSVEKSALFCYYLTERH